MITKCLMVMINDKMMRAIIRPSITLSMRENSFFLPLTIYMMFLAFLEECIKHHGAIPIENGQHGLQFIFAYISPNENEYYGILSLTFYLTISRLVTTGYLVYPVGITPADRKFDKKFGHTTAGISQENDENVQPKQLWSKLNQLFQNNTQLAEILQHMVCRMWRDTYSACSLYLDSCI